MSLSVTTDDSVSRSALFVDRLAEPITKKVSVKRSLECKPSLENSFTPFLK